jgi:hypothetical protein
MAKVTGFPDHVKDTVLGRIEGWVAKPQKLGTGK